MSRRTTIIFQVVALIIQLGNAATSFVPAEYHQLLFAVVALAQAIQALVAHNYNPDGSPAAIPYRPPNLIATIKPPVEQVK